MATEPWDGGREPDEAIPAGEPGSGGCTLAVVALVTLVLMPFVGRALDLSGDAMGAAGVALLLIALTGGAYGFFAGRGRDADDSGVDD